MPSKIPSIFAEVSFHLPMDSVWTYGIPDELQSSIVVGSKVKANFLKTHKLGVVVRIHEEKPSFSTKWIEGLVEDHIPLPPYIFYMQEQIASYYGCSKNEALHLFVSDTRTPQKIKKTPVEELASPLPSQVVKITNPSPLLNEEQKFAVQSIWEASQEGTRFVPTLLHGITGSGKTEVYQALIKEVLKTPGKQVLLLLPEIGITRQIFQRLSNYFPEEKLGFIHSRMGIANKRQMLKDISSGEIRIIVGPRSALFSPFRNLGFIIMDEEHDFSYKSQTSPRYHARRVAFILAKYLNIPLVMGSATPSLEIYYAAVKGQIQLYTLKERFWKTPLPAIQVVDMKDKKEVFSEILLKKIVDTKRKQKQSILFLNRRGFSPFFICEKCSYTFVCPACSISLTYHKKNHRLLCHYCGYHSPIPSHCPECKSSQIRPRGTGTQRLEEEMQELFHGYRILRMDRDSMIRKGAYENIMDVFAEKGADILIGTQMISKGFDFLDVELVGVVSCDLILHIPDFRAGEYVFALISQITGRSGRKTLGDAILQTRFPDHYAIQASVAHDYIQFFEKELDIRKQYGYPPFTKFIRFIVRSPSETKAEDVVEVLAQQVKKLFPQVEIIGPSSCPIGKLHHQYRHHFLLRIKDPVPYIKEIKSLIKTHNQKGDYHVECDVDPLSML